MEFKSYEYRSAGKLLGMTKIRHMWKLKVNGQYYEIKLAESLISGKFVVMVQNDIVYNEKVDSGAKKRGISVSADGLDLMFKTATKGMDLFVNMVKFQPNSSGGKGGDDDDFAQFESSGYRGGAKPAKKSEDSGRPKADQMEGSWAQFDALDSSGDDQTPFDNFESKGGKPTKSGGDPFGKPSQDRDAFGTFTSGAQPKFTAQAKPTDQKSMGLKFKSGVGGAKAAPSGGNKDPFGSKNDDDDGWGAPSSSKPGNQGGWAQVAGGDDDDDNDGFLNFGTAPAQQNKQNFLPNFPAKNPVSNPTRGGSGFGNDAFGQTSSNDPFGGNPGGNRTPQGGNRGSGFDAFGGPGSNQSQNKQFGQPTQPGKPADPFGGWGKSPTPAQPQAPQQNAFDAFGGAPAQNKPQGNNMWNSFNVNKPQGNQFGQPQQQPQQNAFAGQGWGAPAQKPPGQPQQFGQPQQGFGGQPQQGFGGQPQQQRPPQQGQPQQPANMWSNFQKGPGFGGPAPANMQQPQQRPPMPNQPQQQRPPQPPQQGNQWGPAQPQQGGFSGAPQQQPNPFGGPVNPQNPFGGPAQPQQRPPTSPVGQPGPQQGQFQSQPQPQQQAFQQQNLGFSPSPGTSPQQPATSPDNAFGQPITSWDSGFGQPMDQTGHQPQQHDSQPTIEQNPFNNFSQDHQTHQSHPSDQMYPKPDLGHFGNVPEETHQQQTAPAQTDQHFEVQPVQHQEAQSGFDAHHQASDPFNAHPAQPSAHDPFAQHTDQTQIQGLNEQMGALTFNAPAEEQHHQPTEQ